MNSHNPLGIEVTSATMRVLLVIPTVRSGQRETILRFIGQLRYQTAMPGITACIVCNSEATSTEFAVNPPPKDNLVVVSPGYNSGYGGSVHLALDAIDESFDTIVLANDDLAIAGEHDPAWKGLLGDSADVLSAALPLGNSYVEELPSIRAFVFRRLAMLPSGRFKKCLRETVRLNPSQTCGLPLMVMSMSIWDRLGGLDVNHAIYFEDTDFILRAQSDGIIVQATALESLTHSRNLSSASRSVEIFPEACASALLLLSKKSNQQLANNATVYSALCVRFFVRTFQRKPTLGFREVASAVRRLRANSVKPPHEALPYQGWD